MPSCVFRKCKNYDSKVKKDESVTYHKFPSDELIRLKWVAKIRAERCEYDWMPSKRSTVCSAHFEDQDKYTTPKGYVRLKKSAVPVVSSDMVQRAFTPTNLDDVNISDMDSVFDSPRKAAFKKRVQKLNTEKKVLQKNNKVLKNQNKRLNKKISTMTNIVKILKKKNYVTEQQFCDLNLKAEPLNLFNRICQIKKSKKSFRKKYPAALRKFALTLNFYSSAAYKYVRRVFHSALPHPRVLAKWYQNSSMLPGFTKQAFDILKQKSSLSGKILICGLVVDEMALRQHNGQEKVQRD